jgi:hypothetical protein
MTIIEFVEKFSFRNDVVKIHEVFSEHGFRVILGNELEIFQAFLILKIWNEPDELKRFQK